MQDTTSPSGSNYKASTSLQNFGFHGGNGLEDEIVVDALICGFCYEDLDRLTILQRESHYEFHFISEAIINSEASSGSSNILGGKKVPSASKINPNMKSRTWTPREWPPCKETDNFWYSAQETPPPSNFTPGLISLLRKGLLKGHGRGMVRRAVLCYDQVVHVHREPWDAGWGCGYRNFLMACSALMTQPLQPMYFPLLDSPLSPTVRNLQTWIESAWKEGFDKEGERELRKLVNTRKWVGTSDLWVAFIFRGIPARLVDFNLKVHAEGVKSVIDWVVNYFSPYSATDKPTNPSEALKFSPITSTDKMPVILQHDGHSRTVVGYEVDRNGVTSLLVFDPAHRPMAQIREKALAESALDITHLQNQSSQGPPTTSITPGLKRKRSVEVEMLSFGQGPFAPNPQKSGSSIQQYIPSPAKGKLRATGEKTPLDLYGMVKKFRLDPKSLSKKKEYQILYFPMTAPLTDRERMQMKQVTSVKITN